MQDNEHAIHPINLTDNVNLSLQKLMAKHQEARELKKRKCFCVKQRSGIVVMLLALSICCLYSLRLSLLQSEIAAHQAETNYC